MVWHGFVTTYFFVYFFTGSVSSRVLRSTIQISYNIPYKLSRVYLKHRIVQIIIYFRIIIFLNDKHLFRYFLINFSSFSSFFPFFPFSFLLFFPSFFSPPPFFFTPHQTAQKPTFFLCTNRQNRSVYLIGASRSSKCVNLIQWKNYWHYLLLQKK